MSLYHDYRPTELSQLRGNAEAIDALNKALVKDSKKIPHVYLIAGPTGCGKTTIGRIIKTSLNVTDADYNEINSSDFRGIDTVREIIKNSQYRPIESPYRIYLIDECHKMTNDAQNALLKPCEDTPAHVIYILCTTEPDKLIKAIQNRCYRIDVQPLSDRDMKGLLKRIIKDQQDSVDNEILDQIIQDSNGSPRNAIQTLEKVLDTEPDNRMEAAKQTAIVVNQSIELCRALIGNTGWGKVKTILSGLVGQDAESIRRQVLGYSQAVLLKGDNEKAGLVMECFIEPFYNSGFPGLVFACYQSVKG